jgi:hypothetical protein
MAENANSNKPVKSFRLRGVTASVFENKTEDGKSSFFKIAIQRTYKDGDEFKTTTSFGRDDLPIVALLSKRAWEFVLEKEATGRNDDSQS